MSIEEDILAVMPASVRQVVARLPQYDRRAIWAAMAELRNTKLLLRRGDRCDQGKRIYVVAPRPDLLLQEMDTTGDRKKRYRPVLLCWIDGWPAQEPGRRMLWAIVWQGTGYAQQQLARLQHTLGHKANFDLVRMTAADARKLHTAPRQKLS